MKKYMLLFLIVGSLLYACKKSFDPHTANNKPGLNGPNLKTNTGSADLCYYAYTYAGTAGTAGHSNGTGRLSATLNVPSGIAFDSGGNMFIADRENNCIRKITTGGTVSVFAGSTSAVAGFTNATGTAARFDAPMRLAIDVSDNIFVADRDNNVIRKITSAGVVTTFAGSTAGTAGFTNGTGTAAKFDFPVDVTVDKSNGNLYIADQHNNVIRKITSAGVVTTLAGSSSGTSGYADGSASTARFNQATGVAVDGSGNIIVADRFNHCIRKITSTGTTSTIAGVPTDTGLVDGPALKARFNEPYGITVSADGAIFVAELANHCIRRLNTAGEVLTIAGGGLPGLVNGNYCYFNSPVGLAFDASGNLYVADVTNELIRQLQPVTRRLQSCLGWTALEVSPGLTWFRFNAKSNFYLRYSDSIGPQNVNIIDIDLNLCKLVVDHRADNDSTNLTGLAADVTGAIAAVNGTYFEHYNISGVQQHDSFLKGDGTIYWHVGTGTTTYDYLWWKHAGAVYWDNTTLASGLAIDSAFSSTDPYASLSYPNIVSGGPILINNYVITGADIYTAPHGYKNVNMYPRTAVAINPTTNHILFMTADAIETHKYSPYYGMSTGDLAQFIQTYFNYPYALNIDGGGSTTMWIKDQNQGNAANQGVVNQPSGVNPLTATNNYDRQRIKLLNAIVVVPK